MVAAMRGLKAEGGWAVVCTEETEIHPTSDISPAFEGRLWDDRDIPGIARMTQAVHAHGALAGIELVHNGAHCANLYSRETAYGPSTAAIDMCHPVQARAMDKQDIRNLRRWHRAAALRGREAGFDLIYCYAGHDMTVFSHFLSRRRNRRSDEYGGSLENRVRLFREVIEETKDAVGDTCAVAVRFAVEELMGADGLEWDVEGREVVEMLAELPDLWDICLAGWSNDSQTSRFSPEGFQEDYTAFVKTVTTKPVVGVGRFTSPDTMVSQIRRGILDFIGAARPSIADPFLPRKIEEGRIDDIRECIGCNICVTGDNTIVPMRCTQNPTKGEEWRRGWHPERIDAKGSDARVLVVGGGPAGLECARALGQRGYEVALAERSTTLGGRVTREAALPGLSAWARVRDYRLGQISSMANVSVYLDSDLDAGHILEFGFTHVALATGSSWRIDCVGRSNHRPLTSEGLPVVSVDRLLEGCEAIAALPQGRIAIYDDDQFYMANVLAEAIRASGRAVTFITATGEVAPYAHHTLEQARIQARLIELGVDIVPHRIVTRIGAGGLVLSCTYTGRERDLECAALVPVAIRDPDDALYRDLKARSAAWTDAGLVSVAPVGDAITPGTIAAAVYGGHRYARELDLPQGTDLTWFKREMPMLEGDAATAVPAAPIRAMQGTDRA
jgi:dimethylamine/trimethylamine dehydrogenase